MNPVNSGNLRYSRQWGTADQLHTADASITKDGLPGERTRAPRSPDERTGYADSLFLPLALLRRITFRPPGVLIRFRNPWVLLRFSLLG